MKSYKKTLLTALLLAGVTGLISWHARHPKADESCLAYRDGMRQIAIGDTTFAGVIAVPESAMAQALEERYAGLAKEQCSAQLSSLAADEQGLANTPWAAQMPQAAEEVAAAMKECREKRLAGQLKNHTDSTQCSNPRIGEALTRIHYPYGDLVGMFTTRRLELAQKLDAAGDDGVEDQKEFATLALAIAEQERARLKK